MHIGASARGRPVVVLTIPPMFLLSDLFSVRKVLPDSLEQARRPDGKPVYPVFCRKVISCCGDLDALFKDDLLHFELLVAGLTSDGDAEATAAGTAE